MFGLAIWERTSAEDRTAIAERIVGEIAAAHGQRRNQAGEGNSLALILLLAIHEEERLVVADWAADRAAKLVQIEFRRCGVKVAFRVEIGIADEFEERSMEVIRP